jgi:hypothetical protein
MRRRILATLCSVALLSLALVLGASSGASASGSLTVSLGSPLQVTNRVMVTVPVHVVCDPLTGDTAVDRVYVQVQQANGKSISSGSATIEAGPVSPYRGTPFLTCDGSTVNTVNVNVVGNGPFHGGGAIVTAAATHSVGFCSFFCQITDTETAAIGPMGAQLRG